MPVVAERNFDVGAGLGGHDLDAGGAAGLAHGIVGVVHDVKKDLLQLVGIPHHLGQALIEVLDDLDAVAVEVVGAQLDGTAQDRIQLHGLALRRHLAGEAEQVLHDLLGTLRLLQDDAKVFAGSFGQVGIFHQQIGEAEDRRQRIVDFVGHAGNQLSDSRHFFGMDQFDREAWPSR